MAEGVIHVLEVIDIHHDQGEWLFVSNRHRDLFEEHFVEATSIGEARQGVDIGQLIQLRHLLFELPGHLLSLLQEGLELM